MAQANLQISTDRNEPKFRGPPDKHTPKNEETKGEMK